MTAFGVDTKSVHWEGAVGSGDTVPSSVSIIVTTIPDTHTE